MEEVLFSENSQELAVVYLISAILSSTIAMYFFKILRIFQSQHILGLMIGFSLIALGDLMFSITVGLAFVNKTFNGYHWVYLLISSFGFAIIGSVYFLQKSSEKKFQSVLGSLVAILVTASILTCVALQANVLPSFEQYNEYFRITNLATIGYVVFFVMLNQDSDKNKQNVFIIAGFVLLFLSQYVRLFFTIEPSFMTLYASSYVKVASVAIILIALLQSSKEPKNMEVRA